MENLTIAMFGQGSSRLRIHKWESVNYPQVSILRKNKANIENN